MYAFCLLLTYPPDGICAEVPADIKIQTTDIYFIIYSVKHLYLSKITNVHLNILRYFLYKNYS